MAQDPYIELGVSRGASADEIRKAFRKLAKTHHPDANPGNSASEEKFKRVSGAFDILGDPDKRRKFDGGDIDAEGREAARGNPFARGGQGGAPFGQGSQFDGVDLSDIFGDVFGGGRRNGGFAARGADIKARLDIDLEEAIKGGRKRINFTGGRSLDVNIPKGAVGGQTLRLRGQGSAGRGAAGDALIELAIRPHPVYRIEGDQLVMEVPITVPDAVLGGKVQAPTPDGPVTLSVPKGSNSGATLRLKSRGLSDTQGRRGDLLARLVVTLPDGDDPTLKDFAEVWRRERPYSPRRRP